MDGNPRSRGTTEISGLATDFNRMASALDEAKAHEHEMEQSRRDLIASVSHDLRTPLASTRALIEAVSDGIATDPDTEARYLPIRPRRTHPPQPPG